MTIKFNRLDFQFAVFNSHRNNASARADAEFIAQFGQEKFDAHIKPHHEEGIMSILQRKPNKYTLAWVVLVTAYVNEITQDTVESSRLILDGGSPVQVDLNALPQAMEAAAPKLEPTLNRATLDDYVGAHGFVGVTSAGYDEAQAMLQEGDDYATIAADLVGRGLVVAPVATCPAEEHDQTNAECICFHNPLARL